MNAQLKYTDRDVRDNPGQMFALVEEYLSNYTGEFDFLVDCKMRVAQGVSLTTGMVRGVLNCMRSDPRIRLQMPAPKVVEDDDEADVVPIRAARTARCEITEPHEPHGGDALTYRCFGIYEINRHPYSLPATVKRPYLIARTGQLVHTPASASVHWVPESHAYGFVESYFRHGSGAYGSGDLFVKTHCKTTIHNPFLLTDMQAVVLLKTRKQFDKYLTELDGKRPPPSQRKPFAWCGRCEIMRPLDG